MISERSLKKWRMEALQGETCYNKCFGDHEFIDLKDAFIELQRRILCMTQELLDQRLLEKARRKKNDLS